MAYILKIDNDIVVVSLDNKAIAKFSKDEFDFELTPNMAINVYKRVDGTYVFVKKLNTTPIDYKYVKKIPYCFLFLFFGQLGIHEFYAGNPKKGVVWIIMTLVVYFIDYLGVFGLIFSYTAIIIILAMILFCMKSEQEQILVNSRTIFY